MPFGISRKERLQKKKQNFFFFPLVLPQLFLYLKLHSLSHRTFNIHIWYRRRLRHTLERKSRSERNSYMIEETSLKAVSRLRTADYWDRRQGGYYDRIDQNRNSIIEGRRRKMRRRWETTDIEIANLTYYVRAKQVFHSFIP